MPDLDSVAGILARDFGKFHNNGTHSFIIGALAAISISGFARWKLRGSFRDWFLVSFICYALHVAMDSATGGRGVMAIWPLSVNRWQTRPSLFYGFHWSDGWLSQRHVWTFVSELVFTICIIVMTRWLHKRLNR